MNIGIVGCGYVSDHYMETLHHHPELTLIGITDSDRSRAQNLANYYNTSIFDSTEELINNSEVQIIVNLTDPENHFEVNKASLEAGKHVYSEKPLSTDFEQAKELVHLAKEKGLLLSSAPCSILSETAQTLWKAVEDGAIGKPKLVYAELDDNPIYLMHPENWANSRGVPWPYKNEYKTGCTLEHAGYYLTWLAAIFGPAKTVTAFSSCLVPEKTDAPLETPDMSVACIVFESKVVARITCSIVAPYDHRIQLIGDKGVLSCNECWHYGAPVRLERFSQLSLNARKARSVRNSPILQSVFGIGGRKQKLIAKPLSHFGNCLADLKNGKASLIRTLVKLVSKRELVCMDFFRGVAEMAHAIETGNPCLLSSDFVLHVNELTLAIQDAGELSAPYELTTTFEPLNVTSVTNGTNINYYAEKRGLLASIANKAIEILHKH